jgi:hypothetical protein
LEAGWVEPGRVVADTCVVRQKTDWAAWVFWSLILAVIVAAFFVTGWNEPGPSSTYHTDPDDHDKWIGSVWLTAMIVDAVALYLWTEWNNRRGPREPPESSSVSNQGDQANGDGGRAA